MEAIGFGFAVIAEARTLVTSIRTRISNYRQGRETFQALSDSVDRLANNIAEVDRLLQKFPSAVPAEISDLFNEAFAGVRSSLEDSNRILDESFSKRFSEGRSSTLGKLRSRVLRTIRATQLKDKMNDMERQIKEASSQLLPLTLSLGQNLKLQEHQDAVLPRLEKLCSSKSVEKDVYRPGTNAPALTQIVDLDFDSRDEKGNPKTPEGFLKLSVLSDTSSKKFTATVGVMTSAFGVVGMGGVGKSTALQGLARDEDIRKRFTDGVHFMTFGKRATVKDAIREIVKLLKLTGSTEVAKDVKNSMSLREAVDYAVPWFKARACLFVVDDLWPTETCNTGFLNDLRQLLRESPESRMAVSTRSHAIAQCAGSVVSFGARDPLGTVSVNMFMAHATGRDAEVPNLSVSLSKILSICGGLPIALSITGCAVAHLTTTYGDFGSACEAYAKELEKKRSSLGDEDTVDGASINAGILLSLEYLEVEFLKWKEKSSVSIDYSISDLYMSLSVVENWNRFPVLLLSKMWGVDEDVALGVANLFCGMSLATLHKQTIMIHDLQIEFCRRQSTKTKTSSLWHTELLNGYLQSRCTGPSSSSGLPILSFTPRPWWKFPPFTYISNNVTRHLSCSGQGMELAALLMDARWIHLRFRSGVESDFEYVDRFLLQWESEGKSLGDVRQSFKKIYQAIQDSWREKQFGRRAFQFQVCGRLIRLRKANAIVDAYLNSVETHTPKPFLLPLDDFVLNRNGTPVMEISLHGMCNCAVISICGRYIAAGSGKDVIVADTATGDILRCLQGHNASVTCVAFAEGSRKVISGSWDKTVMVWEWESQGSYVQVLKGHGHRVTDVAVSGIGEHIFSVSEDRTLRIWNATSGTQTDMFLQCSGIHCVAINPQHRQIALGLENGTLKVLDSRTKDTIFEGIEAHEKRIESISYSADGLCLATGSMDTNVRVWNSRTWSRISESREDHEFLVTSVTFSPDGRRLASSSGDCCIRVWNVETGECVWVSPKHFSWVMSVAFMSDGRRILCGYSDCSIRIWDTEWEQGRCAHTWEVCGVAISPNGLVVASASADRTLRLWDSQTALPIGVPLEGHTNSVLCVSFSHDGRQVVSASKDKTLIVWDTANFTPAGDALEGHADAVHCVSFSCDGLRILSGSGDCTVRLWDGQTHKPIGDALRGHAQSVTFVSESYDGCHVVSRDLGSNLIVWNRESRTPIWKSENVDIGAENDIANEAVESIIRSCSRRVLHVEPCYREGCTNRSQISYTMRVCSHDKDVILGTLPFCNHWALDERSKLFAAGLETGAVAMCKLLLR